METIGVILMISSAYGGNQGGNEVVRLSGNGGTAVVRKVVRLKPFILLILILLLLLTLPPYHLFTSL